MFRACAAAAIVALGVLVYANTLDVPFVLDDAHNIAENPHVQVRTLGFDELWRAAFQSPSRGRPVANASFALHVALAGPGVRSFHVANLAIHLLASLAAWALAHATLSLVVRTGTDPGLTDREIDWTAALTGLLFVAHPLQTQAVTYVVQRMTSLATLFYLLALLSFVRGRLREAGARRRWWTACAVCFAVALGSKQIAATLPIAMVLYELYFFRDLDWRWLRTPAPLAAGVVFAAIGVVLLGGDFSRFAESYVGRDYGVAERVLTQLRVVPFYASLVVWPLPSRQNLLHGFETSRGWLDPETTLLGGLALVGLVVVAVVSARRERLLSLCIAWWLLQHAIESSVIGLEMVFEHRVYLPLFGPALLGSYSLFRSLRGRRVVAIAIGTACVLSLAAAAHARNERWSDRVTLWSDVVAKNPASARAQNSLGRALEQAGRIEDAIPRFHEALRIDPDHKESHYNLGVIAYGRGQSAAAVRHLSEALRIDPTYARAHNNLAAAYLATGDVTPGIEHLREAARLDPYHANSRFNLAVALERSGRPEEALRWYAEVLALDPGDAVARTRMQALQHTTAGGAK